MSKTNDGPEIDVPDDFSLHDAIHAKSTTPESERKRCPECGSIGINSIGTGLAEALTSHDNDWRCESCRATFDEPDEPDPHD